MNNMNEIQTMIDEAVRLAVKRERRVWTTRMEGLIEERFLNSHPNSKELSTWADRKLTYWDMKMLLKQLRMS